MLTPKIAEKNYDWVYELEARSETDLIVIHHSGIGIDKDLSADEIHRSHVAQGYCGIGYHFVVRKSGYIERGRPIWAIGAHTYGENFHSVGIHLSGDFMKNFPTQNQIEMTAWLIAFIADSYNINIDEKHVCGHCDFNSTDCPGTNLYSLLDTIRGKANFYRFSLPETCPTCGHNL